MNNNIDYYKNEISNVIIEKILKIYDMNNKEKALKYIILKFLSNYDDLSKINLRCINDIAPTMEFISFLYKELGIIDTSNFIKYKGVHIKKFGYFNSMIDVLPEMESICFNFLDIGGIYSHINNLFYEIRQDTLDKVGMYKDISIYSFYYKKFFLDKLNSIFNLQPKAKHIEMKEFGKDLVFLAPLEIITENILKKIEKNSDFLFEINIKECELEDFLYRNIKSLDRNLKAISRQVVVKNGRLDILAKDAKNNHVVIELKVQEDTDIIYQCKQYYTEISRIKNTKNIKIIVVAPNYNESIKKQLVDIKKILNLELYTYKVFSRSLLDKNIDNIKFQKIL